MTPFILKCRTQLPPETIPSDDWVYDRHQQLWIERKSGAPVVTRLRTEAQASQFGETTRTMTMEGVDQPEVTTLQASQFGETTITKTSEGVDQLEAVTVLAEANASYSHF